MRLSQGASLRPDESEGCSPVSNGRTIRLCSSWPSNDPPTPLRPSVDTSVGDRGGARAEFAVVAGTAGCREDVGSVVLRLPVHKRVHPPPGDVGGFIVCV
jgi:hypothetical protein